MHLCKLCETQKYSQFNMGIIEYNYTITNKDKSNYIKQITK